MDVRLQTFISRYLRKYFKEKGVSIYTLLINNVAVNAKVINGHESHFLFDLICHNKTSIQPHIISTDTEGTNQLNFALLDLKNILFAPCYKTITSRAKLIYTFKNPKHYQGYLIKPIKQIKKRLIINEWPNNQKVFTALLAGETTQSIIVKKFSSHKRKSKTKEALWEYNNILMSIYLLWYIDDADLRRYVRTALNRGEAYHQLKRTLADVGGGEFRGKSEMEILIGSECARLVANAIIYYNAYMLSQLITRKEQQGDTKAIEFLSRISPIAWQHVNLLGTYDFSFAQPVNTEALVETMFQLLDLELAKLKT